MSGRKEAVDIVERLRTEGQVLHDAADEIERLRKLYLSKCREHQLAELFAKKQRDNPGPPGIKEIPLSQILGAKDGM